MEVSFHDRVCFAPAGRVPVACFVLFVGRGSWGFGVSVERPCSPSGPWVCLFVCPPGGGYAFIGAVAAAGAEWIGGLMGE